MISRGKMFALIFLPAAGALVFSLALVQQKNLELNRERLEARLKEQWAAAAMGLEGGSGPAEFRRLFEKTGLRTTLVDREGRVMFDSEEGEISESHRERPEIRNALFGVPTLARRLSRTTKTETVYYSEALPDGKILRVSFPAADFEEESRALFAQTLTGLLLSAAAAAGFAFLVSRGQGRLQAELALAVGAAQEGGMDLPSFHDDSLDKALYALSAATRELEEAGLRNAELDARLEFVLSSIFEGIVLFENDLIVYHNKRAEEILNYKPPSAVSRIDRPEMINVFEALTAGQASELRLGDRVIAVARAEAGRSRLVILHDISDREKYSGYKSELIGNISHELKTPLALIMAAAEVVAKDRDIPPPRLEKFLSAIHKNAKRLDVLLEDLTFLHKLESLSVTEAPAADLEEMLSEIKDLVDPQGKEILYDFDPGRIGVQAAHLLSLLTNLISNAIKYSSGATVRVEVRKKEKTVVVRVADEGPPISPGERERIFERFYSLSESRNREMSGSGLGLAIVKHIARQYNGRAAVSDNEYSGNTFSVTLIEK